MAKTAKNSAYRYVNDLRRHDYMQAQGELVRSAFMPLGLALLFLVIVAFVGGNMFGYGREGVLLVVCAAVIAGYMAMNIGANDVANNMGAAVGGKVLTVGTALTIAAVCECAGALLAGGDVVQTVAKGIIAPGGTMGAVEFRYTMLSALLAAALWVNLATLLNAPVSTTHSIVGGVLGAGIAAAGLDLVNWVTVSRIAASWLISPILGGAIAALLLYVIKTQILNVDDRLRAAERGLPLLIALMAGAFAAYMLLKGLSKVWAPNLVKVAIISVITGIVVWLLARPYIARRVVTLDNRKKDIHGLFDVPLIIGTALLSFAHGANDVANAVGPLAAIVSTMGDSSAVGGRVHVPLWEMAVGAFGLAIGICLFGPRLIRIVGDKITRLNSPRAYCVALSTAVTVLLAAALGLPVSSTHIAVGAVFGVGFLREFSENPNRRKLRPGHKLNATAQDAFNSRNIRRRRFLVRRRFFWSIGAAWVITLPSSALLAALLYASLRFLVSMGA